MNESSVHYAFNKSRLIHGSWSSCCLDIMLSQLCFWLKRRSNWTPLESSVQLSRRCCCCYWWLDQTTSNPLIKQLGYEMEMPVADSGWIAYTSDVTMAVSINIRIIRRCHIRNISHKRDTWEATSEITVRREIASLKQYPRGVNLHQSISHLTGDNPLRIIRLMT